MKEVLLLKAVHVISHGSIPSCPLCNKCRWLFKRNAVALSGAFFFLWCWSKGSVCVHASMCVGKGGLSQSIRFH